MNAQELRRHHLGRRMASGLALVAVTLASVTTHGRDTDIDVTHFPDLSIRSNGSGYTTMADISYAWSGRVTIEMGVFGRIKRWVLYPKLHAGSHAVLPLSEYAASKSYPFGKRPKSVHVNVEQQFPSSAVVNFARVLCEDNAKRMRRQGMSDRGIFSRNHVVSFDVIDYSDIDVTSEVGLGSDEVDPYKPRIPNIHYATVTCLKTNGPTVAGGNQSFGVENDLEKIEFHIGEESNKSGHCAIDLYGHFMTTQQRSRVDYHFIHRETGRRSAGYSLVTNSSKRGNFSHRFDVPQGENHDGTGSIELVVTNFEHSPSVMAFAITCEKGGATGFATTLPPELSLEVKPKDTVMVDGQICPAQASLIAGIRARSDLEGKIIFVGSGYFSKPLPYQLANGHGKQFSETMELKWKTSGGFGSALSIGGGNQPKPLKNQTINMGFNLVGTDGDVAYQFERKSFTLSCRRPKVSPGIQAADNLATGVHVHYATLTVRPEAVLNGARCGVRIDATLRANATDATISLDVRDRRGATLARHTVTTDSQKQAYVRDFIDLADTGSQGIGSLTANVGNTGERSGALRLVGTSVPFESNSVPFRITCREPSPGDLTANPVLPGSSLPAISGLTMRPVQPRPGAAVAAGAGSVTLKPDAEQPASVFGAKRMKPRDDKDEPDAGAIGAMTAKPGGAKADNKVGKIAMQAPAVTLRRADASVTHANISVRGRVGTVQAKIVNLGDADLRGTVIIQVRNGRGGTVANITEPLSLKAGDSRAIQKRFRVGRAKVFVADVSVRAGNDADRRNNRKTAKVSR